jgi:N-acetylornithine carbamoyltransferase
MELKSGAAPARFDGARLVAVFLDPSLRTRTSLEMACNMLGVHAVALNPGKDAWAMETKKGAVMDADKPEHVADAIRVLASYADVLAVRSFARMQDAAEDRAEPVLSAFLEYTKQPVINLESARWHPLQGLADAATWISHFGPDLQGQPLTLSWTPHVKSLPGAVPNQVLVSAALMGMDVTIAHPEGMDLDPEVVSFAGALAKRGGGGVRTLHDQDEALAGARVVVGKSWGGFSGYGKREEEAQRRNDLRGWQITPDKMALTDGAGFMHCLPVRRNVEVADAVLDGPNSWAFEEAANRLWTTAALLERVLAAEEGSWSE